MRPLKFIVVAALLCASTTLAEETRTPWPEHLVGDVISPFYDPIDKSWRWDGIAIVGGTLASSLLLNEYADEHVPGGTPVAANGSEWISNIGLGLTLATPVAFLVAGSIAEKGSETRTDLWQTTEELVEALGFAGTTTLLLKYTVSRDRPDGSDDHSFPSLHVSAAFSVAGILAARYPWYVGALSLAGASAVAFSRVDLDQHYFSDVAAGAGIGLFFAAGVHTYHKHFRPGASSTSMPMLLPLSSPNTYGLSMTGHF